MVTVWPFETTTPVCHEVEGAIVVTVVTMTVCWTEVEVGVLDPELELFPETDWEEPLCVAEGCCDPEFCRRCKMRTRIPTSHERYTQIVLQ